MVTNVFTITTITTRVVEFKFLNSKFVISIDTVNHDSTPILPGAWWFNPTGSYFV